MSTYLLICDTTLNGDKDGVVLATSAKMPPNGYADEIRARLDELADHNGCENAVEYVNQYGKPEFTIAKVVQVVDLKVPENPKILCTRRDV